MIKLIGGYYLDSDKYCYMLGKKQKVKNSKTGEEEIKFIPETFHRKISDALESLYQNLGRQIVSKKDMDLSEMILEMKKIEEKLSKLVKF